MKRLLAIVLALSLTGCATVYREAYHGVDNVGRPYTTESTYIYLIGRAKVFIGPCGPSQVVPADMETCVDVEGAAISDMGSNLLSAIAGGIIGALPVILPAL